MSSHLRHCPKHRKPLPCPRCASTVPIIQPSTLPGLVHTDLPHEFKEGMCVYCGVSENDAVTSICPQRNIEAANNTTGKRELEEVYAKKERNAAKSRARRKKQRDAIAAIKEKLKIPFAEVKRIAKTKADAEKLPSMNAGKYMTDAPTGKGALVYKPTRKLDEIDAAISRGKLLGSQTFDEETGETFFADNDRKHVVPEGTGAQSDEKPEITGVSEKGFIYDKESTVKRFLARIDGPEYLTGLSAAVNEHSFQEGCETYCRLCQQVVDESYLHFSSVHGDPLEPTHDERFGDVVRKFVRKFEHAHARLEKAGRAATLTRLADEKARAEIAAIKAGYVKLNRKWILRGTA